MTLTPSERRKDEFLALLAHELRNPLAPIRNALHLIHLADPQGHSPHAAELAVIERQVDHLVRLVDDLLDVSRISQGKINLQMEHLDLAGVVARAVESSQPLLDVRRHQFTVNLPSEPLTVKGDWVRLVQILTNLLNNAAKYTPECGQIRLSVARANWNTGQPAGQAVIRVRDTGAGIPAEVLPHVFDLFAQNEHTLDRAEGGLGIGLTLVRRLTEMHGGSVQAFSAGPDLGSEFVVQLPPAAVPEMDAIAPEATSPATGAAGRRVLVVDDNQDSVSTLARLLRTLGNEVSTAATGLEALARAEQLDPEVILLDIGLPGMDGFTVARSLRSQRRFDNIVLVALTGYGSPEDRRQSQVAGFNAHLVKPVDLESLKALLAHPEALSPRVDNK